MVQRYRSSCRKAIAAVARREAANYGTMYPVELTQKRPHTTPKRIEKTGMYRFRRGCGGRNSGRMRLTSLKWAAYKLKNNNDTVLLAA